MCFLPPCYWEPNYARELYTCPPQLWHLCLPSLTPTWQRAFCLTCHLIRDRICPLFSVCPSYECRREGESCFGGALRAARLPRPPQHKCKSCCGATGGRASRYLWGRLFASGTNLSSLLSPRDGRAILVVKPQKWVPGLWQAPSCQFCGTCDPELTSSSTTTEDGLLCRACAIAKWITPCKGNERERQLQCRKCFVHQLPPILHPERLKTVCLQLCVMSCSVCHLISSPGIVRHA